MVCLINVISSYIASNSSIERKRNRETIENRNNLLERMSYVVFVGRLFGSGGKIVIYDFRVENDAQNLLKYGFVKNGRIKKMNWQMRENPCS